MQFSELLTELNNRIAAAKISGFWTDTMKKEWINQAGQRVCDFRHWKVLELAKYTTTKANQEYYDYPAEFKVNSIYQLQVDGKEYTKKTWTEYQAFKNTKSTEKIFASHDNFYFINPTPTEAGKEILIFGIKKWVKLVLDTDTPILPSEFDGAIVKIALAICLQKERRYNEAVAEINEVEAPASPNIPESGGILAKLSNREDEGNLGFCGLAKSSRWA